jgi:hypothetical protein
MFNPNRSSRCWNFNIRTIHTQTNIYIVYFPHAWTCECVCVWERERERERATIKAWKPLGRIQWHKPIYYASKTWDFKMQLSLTHRQTFSNQNIPGTGKMSRASGNQWNTEASPKDWQPDLPWLSIVELVELLNTHYTQQQ